MTVHDIARERVQTYVSAFAACLGVTPDQLSFKWELISGPGPAQVDDDIQTLRVCLNGRWSTLVFPDFAMKSLAESPMILLGYKTEILEAIRRLMGLSRPVPDSECPDRWVKDGDAFPGEPA